jgi:hypothetical protein
MMFDEEVKQLVSYLQETKTPDVLGEIALLFAWKSLHKKEPDSVPPLTDVYEKSKLLRDVYSKITERADKKLLDIFSDSEMEDKVSTEQMRDIVREVDKFPESDTLKIFEILYDLVSKKLKSTKLKDKDEVTIPKYVIEIMVGVSQPLSGEVYAPFTPSIPLAVRASSGKAQVTYQAHSLSLLVRATLLMCESEIQFMKEDPFEYPITNINGIIKEFDTVLMIPHFGRKVSKIGPDIYRRFSRVLMAMLKRFNMVWLNVRVDL